MNSPEVKQSLQMAEQLANDPEALAKFQSQLAEALGAFCVSFRKALRIAGGWFDRGLMAPHLTLYQPNPSRRGPGVHGEGQRADGPQHARADGAGPRGHDSGALN